MNTDNRKKGGHTDRKTDKQTSRKTQSKNYEKAWNPEIIFKWYYSDKEIDRARQIFKLTFLVRLIKNINIKRDHKDRYMNNTDNRKKGDTQTKKQTNRQADRNSRCVSKSNNYDLVEKVTRIRGSNPQHLTTPHRAKMGGSPRQGRGETWPSSGGRGGLFLRPPSSTSSLIFLSPCFLFRFGSCMLLKHHSHNSLIKDTLQFTMVICRNE